MLGEIFRAIFWPIIRDELVRFVREYAQDHEYAVKVDNAVHAAVNAETPEEKLSASKKLQEALRR
jgi:hypothetical protein